jgi:hypothetical protein
MMSTSAAATPPIDRAAFEARLVREGYLESEVKVVEAGKVIGEHSHDFDVLALADGPVLYVLSKRASQRESMEGGSLLGLRPPVNEGDEHGHVRSTGVVSVLCMLSWSGQPEETFALCLCEPDAGGARELVACGGAPTHTDETLDDPLPLIGGWNAHQASVGHRAPAAAALAPTIVCAASQRLAVCGDDGRAALVTQLWVGTSAAMLHCCGCDGQSTPLASLALSHVPRRMEPVPMQHGQLDGLAVLCASAGAVRSQFPAAAATIGAGPTCTAILLHVHDEAALRLRPQQVGCDKSRNRGNKMQQHVCTLHLRDSVTEIPTELEALGDKTSATLATSLDGVLRMVAPCWERETKCDREGERTTSEGEGAGEREG